MTDNLAQPKRGELSPVTRRRGGAPRGNVNALKHSLSSRRVRAAICAGRLTEGHPCPKHHSCACPSGTGRRCPAGTRARDRDTGPSFSGRASVCPIPTGYVLCWYGHSIRDDGGTMKAERGSVALGLDRALEPMQLVALAHGLSHTDVGARLKMANVAAPPAREEGRGDRSLRHLPMCRRLQARCHARDRPRPVTVAC